MTQLFGHQDVLKRLVNGYAQKRLHHSLIMAGPEGVGRETLVMQFMRSVLKDDAKIEANSHPHIFFIRPVFDEKKQRYKRDITLESLEGLTNFLRLTPTLDLPRFIVVKPSDGMNNQTQNAILKVLEEPPANTYFILLVTQLSAILPTIRSRCLALTLEPLSPHDFSAALQHYLPSADLNTLDSYQNLANGVVGTVLHFEREQILDHYTEFCRASLEWMDERNTVVVMRYGETMAQADMQETIDAVITLFLQRLSDLIKALAQQRTMSFCHEIEQQLFSHWQAISVHKLLDDYERLQRVWQEGVDAYLDRKIVLLSFFKVVAGMDKTKAGVV